MNHPLKFKSSNQSFKPDMAHTVLFFGVQFVSILFYFINVSVIQNFVPFRFSLFISFLYFYFLTSDNSAFCQDSKSLYFPKILKLMWNSSTLVA